MIYSGTEIGAIRLLPAQGRYLYYSIIGIFDWQYNCIIQVRHSMKFINSY